jgi:hypothetical protein
MAKKAWDKSDDPMAMLDAIRGVASERKLRLFSFALCQRLRFTRDSAKDGKAFLARAEQLFDAPPRPPGWALHATEEEVAHDPDTWYSLEDDVCGRFDLAWSGFLEADSTPIEWEGDPAFTDAVMDSWAATTILGEMCAEDPWAGASNAAEVAVTLAVRKAIQAGQPRSAAEAGSGAAARAEVCQILRDVLGNPFRPVPPQRGKRRWEEQRRWWLDAKTGVARKIAEAIYAEGCFSDSPILADALEEAGCTNPDLLSHLRGTGPHVRGCWAIDLVLGKA